MPAPGDNNYSSLDSWYINLLKSAVRGLIFPIIRIIQRLLGGQLSRIQMSGHYLQASSREQLLHRCQEAPVRQAPLLQRQFKWLPATTDVNNQDDTDGSSRHGNGLPPRDGRVRVMVWNVLADALSQGRDNFIKCPKESLLWDHRKYAILEEILTYDPDIICLQEVDHYEDFFLPVLKQVGYNGAFNPKPDSPCLDCVINNGPDGCVVFFKTDKFKLVKSTLPNLEVSIEGIQYISNQVAVVHHLKCVSSQLPEEEICVATTHLKAKPGYEKMRHKQGQYLIDLIEDYAKDIPVIVGGDFNAEPTEDVYGAFERSRLDLGSVYKKLSADGETEPPYTTWKIRPRREECHTIDYIWYTKKHLEPVALLEFPGGDDIGSGRLPSWSYPSDHLSLVGDFVFKQS